jgi:hypothetical protein
MLSGRPGIVYAFARSKKPFRGVLMRSILRISVATFVALVMCVPAFPKQSASASNFQPKTQDNDRDRGGHEHHPHLRGAIRELQEAKKELQTAAHDFGGHREDALKAVDEAIRQLQQALQYDKK